MNILISGGTGYIGRNLSKKLINEKHNISILTRNKFRAEELFGKNINIIEQKDLSSELKFDCIINLSGEPIAAHNWNKITKEKIINSRINSTKTLVDFIRNQNPADRTKVLINSSAIGYYSSRQDEQLNESSSSGNDFLSSVCRQWESEAFEAEKYGTRVVTIRTGLVLGSEGAFKRMLLPFRLYLGGPLGNGRQWLSWIHIHDLIDIYYYAILNNNIKGAVNAVSPNPNTMNEFCKILGRAIHRPSLLRVPSFILRLIFGEMADVLLNSEKVYPEKLINSGFKFLFPLLDMTFKDIINI